MPSMQPQRSSGRVPVSWLSVKVHALFGAQPLMPGGLPSLSRSRSNSVFLTASWSWPLRTKSKAAACLADLAQSTMACRVRSWL
jgi:hypothetical protein